VWQLGTTQRGESIKIETYVEQSIDHELSANIIDLCPVGALNNKPYQYSARAWELEQRETVSPHDCVGSNLYAHVVQGVVKRMTPRHNEAVNETWLSDRDRFSYEGMYSKDRLLQPRLKAHGHWHDIGWEQALELLVEQIARTEKSQIGMLASPSITLEEAYLLTRIAEHLGTANIDHRVNRRDFSDQDQDPFFHGWGVKSPILKQKGRSSLLARTYARRRPFWHIGYVKPPWPVHGSVLRIPALTNTTTPYWPTFPDPVLSACWQAWR
jgi:NADH-quinone oxidoreductase subunit G